MFQSHGLSPEIAVWPELSSCRLSRSGAKGNWVAQAWHETGKKFQAERDTTTPVGARLRAAPAAGNLSPCHARHSPRAIKRDSLSKMSRSRLTTCARAGDYFDGSAGGFGGKRAAPAPLGT